MMGRDSTDSSLMFGNVIKAMIEFDKAVNSSPDDIEIRLLRANFSYRLPEGFFRRSATAMADFEYLIQRYEQDNSIFSNETYLRIMENLAGVYERLEIDEEAQLLWNRLFSLTGDPKYQALANKSGEETHFDPEKARSMTWQQALQEGIRLHGLAVAGNKKAGKIAEALLEGLHKQKPRDPIAQGYYGSIMALAARDSGNPSVMFSKVIKGLNLIKEAVARDNNNPRLRILRGYVAYHLPEAFFHMGSMAADDFKFLIQAYENDKSILSRELYFKILCDLGTLYRRFGDTRKAQKVWSKLLKESGTYQLTSV
jgi:tetratricopeptide (TPR) repeat protein